MLNVVNSKILYPTKGCLKFILHKTRNICYLRRRSNENFMKTVIKGATIVNEGEQYRGTVVVENDKIIRVLRHDKNEETDIEADSFIEANGMYLIPGVIDDHVHFREPGLTEKATIYSESRAAAAGGVTSFMDMPNTKPQTTTMEALEEKFAIAEKESAINYSFFFGATNDNSNLFGKLNPGEVCGIKLFMGASTGNMLVDDRNKLDSIFAGTTLPIAVHCEDGNIIAGNTERIKREAGDSPGVEYHPIIRNSEACYKSTKSAIELAKKHGSRLHIMHISTKEEIELLKNIDDKRITAEATPAHLYFCDKDYKRLGTKIKCNPAIKTEEDREALRQAIKSGEIDLIGTDHAPHRIEDKKGGALTAASGIPTIQFSLLAMLQMHDEGVFTIEEIVEKMCHAPSRIFDIDKRGYIKEGYYADIVLLKPATPHKIEEKDIISKCGWSPFEGETFGWEVKQTWVNGNCVYKDGRIAEEAQGRKLTFNR